MENWIEAILTGAALLFFVLGISSLVVIGAQPGNAEEAIKERVEHGFFGVVGLVLSGLFVYALSTL